MVRFKVGVNLKGLQPQMLVALRVVEQEYDRFGYETVVTSANDSQHMKESKHYSGNALDFRTRHVIDAHLIDIIGEIKHILTPIGFDVVHEYDHLHVEHDEKR